MIRVEEERDQAPEPKITGFRFKPVEHNGEIPVGAKRDPAGGKVASTGRFELNVAGTELANGLAKKLRLDKDTYVFKVTYDEESGLIGLYPEPFTTKGCAPIRRNTAKRTMTTYLHKAFEEAPSLRPVGARHCPMTLGTDEDGKSCLVVSLFVALNRRVTPRGPRNGEKAEAKHKDEKGKDQSATDAGGKEKTA